MKIIKRSGAEAVFDISKIIIAINKANHEVVEAERLTADQIKEIAQYIEDSCKDANHALNVEDIQDLVEDQLMDKRAFLLPGNTLLTAINVPWYVNPTLRMNRF